jgi:hypothetical protein
MEARLAKLRALQEDLNREQKRLDQEAQELEVAERVFGRLEAEADVKVLPYTPPSTRHDSLFSDNDSADMPPMASSALRTKLERA